jgi:YD repeat-containing protein
MLAGTGTTTWNYDANRGFLRSKIYADSNGTTYSNNVSGKIVSRTWARGTTTDYSYNNAGDLTAINYSDDTPDVSYTLDRRGRRTSVTWGTNTVNLSYNAAGQLTNETWSAGIIRDISEGLWHLGSHLLIRYCACVSVRNLLAWPRHGPTPPNRPRRWLVSRHRPRQRPPPDLPRRRRPPPFLGELVGGIDYGAVAAAAAGFGERLEKEKALAAMLKRVVDKI